ncbi:MAG TPA: adenylate/guanylate cyclase domain-containing protein [Cyanobacteria bacterium UBA8803]|nr:adenylate/guanylate cyclase domain-containing protein [Cyanobacteria bacterium UBA9273]HBL57414.1 adenylate/guanylate cyclase domain-containing protein [Cyanobacteria bacterium UBA8803]
MSDRSKRRNKNPSPSFLSLFSNVKQRIWQWRGVWLVAPTVAGIAIALRLCGWLESWEWAAFDQYVRWRPQETRDERIVIVGIDEADLKRVRQWPIPDLVLAQLIEKIKAQNPKAIGLDLYRDLPVPPGNAELERVFQSTPNLIGIENLNEAEPNLAIAPPPVLDRLGQVGFNNIVADNDGKLRRALLYLIKNDQPTVSFGMRLALFYLEEQNILPQPTASDPQVFQWGKGIFRPFTPNDGGYVRADDGGYQILLNYRGAGGSFRTVSMTEVLQDRIPTDLMRDRIILIGATATSLNDFFYTPYSSDRIATQERTAGVEIQANTISHFLSAVLEGRSGIKTWSEPIEGLWIVFWSFTGATLCWTLRDAGGVGNLLPLWTVVSLLLATGSLAGSTYLAFIVGGWWIPAIPPALALLGSATLLTGYIAHEEHQERQTVMNLFGRHVTQPIAEAIWRDRHELLAQGRLKGRKMTATVLFSDLQGFSTVAEVMEPEILMDWLNEYMEAMVELVLQHGGIVDKFIGDAIMAVFGVPIPRTTSDEIAQDAIAAVQCALAMAERLENLNQQWQLQGYPRTAMRVGIATGAVVTGSLGSSQRVDYTTLGDSVNVASRLESYDKSLDGGICRILINEETYQYLQNKFTTKPIGSVILRGREQPAVVYQVLD